MKRLVTKDEYNEYIDFLDESVRLHGPEESAANELLASLQTEEVLAGIFAGRTITSTDVAHIRSCYTRNTTDLLTKSFEDGTWVLADMMDISNRLYSVIDEVINIIDECDCYSM